MTAREQGPDVSDAASSGRKGHDAALRNAVERVRAARRAHLDAKRQALEALTRATIARARTTQATLVQAMAEARSIGEARVLAQL